MLLAAGEAVASQVDPRALGAALLPPVEHLRASSAQVAVAVARQAEKEGVATVHHDNLIQAVQDAMWWPTYPEITETSGPGTSGETETVIAESEPMMPETEDEADDAESADAATPAKGSKSARASKGSKQS